jgi:hypothetical protein
MHKLSTAGVIALALSFPIAAQAATDAELDEIRAQIRELKSSYEARIQALEQKLKDATAEKAAATPAPAVTPAQAGAQSPKTSSSLSAFNPAISAILAGSYNNFSQDPASYRLSGFAPAPDTGPGRRGFSLGESELTFSANVDHKFAGALTFAVSPENSVEVEEAFGTFNGAPFGVVPKFGRFLSGVGYLKEQHAHGWDFVDRPLAYDAFLGGQYKTDGIQLRWVAPTEHFVELGGELGNGDVFPGTPRGKNGIGSTVLFARTGGDVNESHSWLAGLSYLDARPESRPDPFVGAMGDEMPAAFTGRSRTLGAQFVWKYAPNGNPARTNLKVQGEYFWRKENGELSAVGVPIEGDPNAGAVSWRQGGGYVQGVYQFMPMWRAGVRYDRLDPGSRSSFNPERASAMLDWSPSEFSRVRLQFARAKLAPDLTDNQVFVQYILSLGAHGAHRY